MHVRQEAFIPRNPQEALKLRGAPRLFALGRYVMTQGHPIERHNTDGGAVELRKIIQHRAYENVSLTVRAEEYDARDEHPYALECGVSEDLLEMRVKLEYQKLDRGDEFFGTQDEYFKMIEALFVSHVRAELRGDS